jgi:hypothetical protein
MGLDLGKGGRFETGGLCGPAWKPDRAGLWTMAY